MAMFNFFPSVVLVFLFLGVPTLGACQMMGGTGVVLDFVHGEPIPGVAVDMVCGRSGFWKTLYIGEKSVITDAAGQYTFSFYDFLGCTFVSLDVRKLGYVRATDLGLQWERDLSDQLATVRYLIRDTDAVMVRIDLLSYKLPGTHFFPDGRPARFSNYKNAFEAFYEAKTLAQTPSERQSIREHEFCPKLAELYALLDDEDLRQLGKYGSPPGTFTFYFLGKRYSGNMDHAREVVQYCSSLESR